MPHEYVAPCLIDIRMRASRKCKGLKNIKAYPISGGVQGPRFPRWKSGLSKLAIVVIVVIILVAVAGGASYYFVSMRGSPSSPLILYTADAYVAEANTLESGFTNSSHLQMAPPKAGASFLLAQEIAQGNPVSVFISVAKPAVESLYLKNESSGWAVAFAADQMSIAYSNATLQNSAAMTVINSYDTAVSTNSTTAWYNFYSNLTSSSVKVGISNPNSDPAGFRAWMVLQSAGYIYANNDTGYFVNRMLSNSGNVTASSAADLVAPLVAGQIQFLFIYRSAIEPQHLNSLQLPSGVNFGNVAYNAFYSQFTYTISSGVQQGSAIILWITVPKDSTDYTDSVKFVAYVIQNSQTLLKPFGLTSIVPPKIYNDTSIPASLQQLITQGSLLYGGAL